MNNELELMNITIENTGDARIQIGILNYDETEIQIR